MHKSDLRLYAITHRDWLQGRTLAQDVERALEGGATMVQLREKELSFDDFLTQAMEIKALCQRYQVPFIINDNIDVALACDADGVHVGQSDASVAEARQRLGPGKIVGATAKTIAQAKAAQGAGADYLGSGAVFGSTTKLDAKPMDLDLFAQICQAVTIPVCAIGGITLENLSALGGTGLAGVALVSTIFAVNDITQQCKDLSKVLNTVLKGELPKVLTIAGSDCSGGAGIQADLKTMTAHGVYGMSVLTALTAQNTMGVTAIAPCTPDFVAAQLDAVFQDIHPDAVKIGMVSSSAIIAVIAQKLQQYQAQNIVVDPVMVSTSGARLIDLDAQTALVENLLPLGTVITPNIPEAEMLCGFAIATEEDMMRAAQVLGTQVPGAVLVKGGHLVNDAMDLLYQGGNSRWFRAQRIDNPNTHGTGCTLSSAIACNLAMGQTLPNAIANAKAYLVGALSAQLNLGQGAGPLNHVFAIQ